MGKYHIPRTSGRNYRARPLKKLKPRENVTFINSVNRWSAKQVWNSNT